MFHKTFLRASPPAGGIALDFFRFQRQRVLAKCADRRVPDASEFRSRRRVYTRYKKKKQAPFKSTSMMKSPKGIRRRRRALLYNTVSKNGKRLLNGEETRLKEYPETLVEFVSRRFRRNYNVNYVKTKSNTEEKEKIFLNSRHGYKTSV